MRRRLLWTVAAAILIAAYRPSPSNAGDWDRTTTAVFEHPVQIPGRVLPAGIYVFKLADIQGERNFVQIWNADETVLLATVLGWPDYLRQTPSETHFVFEERENGEPPALKSWFCRGSSHGQTFLYPKQDAK